MQQHEQDVLRYLLRMPGERAAQLILLSALSLEPAPEVGVVLEAVLDQKHHTGPMEWASSVARVNLFLRQRLEWDLASCERLLSNRETPPAQELVAASRALLQPWRKTARRSQVWEQWPDSEAPPWHDLSQPARLKLVQVFLGLIAVPLVTPYVAEPSEGHWTLCYLATMLVGASAIQRGSLDLDTLAVLFTADLTLTPETAAELAEIVTAGGALERMHSKFPVQLNEGWLN